ncbi:MAG: hypothetical protein WC773_00150 [Patescibacteria group bacterium]
MDGKEPSSHLGHVAFVILAFVLGGIVGYMVGAAYNSMYTNEDSSFLSSWVKKTNSTASPSATTSASPSATATTTASPSATATP